MNIFGGILQTIEKYLAEKALQFALALPAFLVHGLAVFGVDEAQIFQKALDQLIADRKAGKNWEKALTDALNVFYTGEVTEMNKVAMAALEWFSKTFDSVGQDITTLASQTISDKTVR